jgi:uncharacterized protein (TIGR04255 family)
MARKFNSKMSKLLNAPLLEVIFELRWKITNKSDLGRCQYLHGDMYSKLIEKYPIREPLTPVEFPSELFINNPAHRFRTRKGGYPLFQIGPGVITLNTIDENYSWPEYFKLIEELINTFFEVYHAVEFEKFTPILRFIDFFKINSEVTNLIDFIRESLNTNIEQRFFEALHAPSIVTLNLSYPTDLGLFTFNLNNGVNQKTEKGLVVQTGVNGMEFEPNSQELLKWINNSHEFCSEIFKKMTAGELYKSFK